MALLSSLALVACGGGAPTAPTAPTPGAAPVPTSRHIVIISIDGLRPDAIAAAGATNIPSLAARGAFTWNARTIRPSNTLPSHVSMLTGQTPDVHGITWDDYLPSRGRITVPTLFTIARSKGLRTSLVAGKDKFRTLSEAGGIDSAWTSSMTDEELASRAAADAMGGAHVVFVHLPDVDLTGHSQRWMSAAYLSAVRRADQAVGIILTSLPADATVILTADHGGRPDGHGTDDPIDMTIPWIIAGPQIVSGLEIFAEVRTVDTAATVAYILGLPLPSNAAGRPVLDAFAYPPSSLEKTSR